MISSESPYTLSPSVRTGTLSCPEMASSSTRSALATGTLTMV